MTFLHDFPSAIQPADGDRSSAFSDCTVLTIPAHSLATSLLIREASMAKNMALKRAAKANRRKMIVAQKRKSETITGALSEQVRRAAGYPVQCCLVTEGLLERGSGVLILARGVTTDQLAVGLFLVDSFCTGIKNVIFSRIGGLEFDAMLHSLEVEVALESVEPSFARKLM